MTEAQMHFRHTQTPQHATLIAAECMICGSLMASTSMRLLWFAEEQHVCPTQRLEIKQRDRLA
jgi:hypothetical protein